MSRADLVPSDRSHVRDIILLYWPCLTESVKEQFWREDPEACAKADATLSEAYRRAAAPERHLIASWYPTKPTRPSLWERFKRWFRYRDERDV